MEGSYHEWCPMTAASVFYPVAVHAHVPELESLPRHPSTHASTRLYHRTRHQRHLLSGRVCASSIPFVLLVLGLLPTRDRAAIRLPSFADRKPFPGILRVLSSFPRCLLVCSGITVSLTMTYLYNDGVHSQLANLTLQPSNPPLQPLTFLSIQLIDLKSLTTSLVQFGTQRCHFLQNSGELRSGRVRL